MFFWIEWISHCAPVWWMVDVLFGTKNNNFDKINGNNVLIVAMFSLILFRLKCKTCNWIFVDKRRPRDCSPLCIHHHQSKRFCFMFHLWIPQFQCFYLSIDVLQFISCCHFFFVRCFDPTMRMYMLICFESSIPKW